MPRRSSSGTSISRPLVRRMNGGHHTPAGESHTSLALTGMKEDDMFGKPLSEYLGFQKVILGLLAAVGLARLVTVPCGPAQHDRRLAVHERRGLGRGHLLRRCGVHEGLRKRTSRSSRWPSSRPCVQQCIAIVGILFAIGGYSERLRGPRIQLWRPESVVPRPGPPDHRHHRPSAPALGCGVSRHADHEEGGAPNRGGLS